MSWSRIAASRLAVASIVISAMLIASAPLPSLARGPVGSRAAASDRSAELSQALSADGTFRGGAGLPGTVDASQWTLVSDLAAGEPPRFAAADVAVQPRAGGTWSGLGSDGSATEGAINEWVRAIAVSGNDLYVGGDFTDVAGIPEADYVAKWNGSNWSALGSNGSGNGAITDYVYALGVSGANVYVAGFFLNAAGNGAADYIAMWDGVAWSALGSDGGGNGAVSGTIYALAVSGGDVYVGGNFTNAAGVAEADYVARWNGGWSALGSNGAGNGALNDEVLALAVSGDEVYAGGLFTDAGGVGAADYVARWNGSWSALGSNGGALNGTVYALAASGTDVYVGGQFYDAAGIATADYVAKWSGSAWSALGSSGSGNGALSNHVYALAVSGADLYVGGPFNDSAGIGTADRIAKWSGGAWSGLGSDGAGNGALGSTVMALAASGTSLYVGGMFSNAAGIPTADYVAKWNPGSATALRRPDARIRVGSGAYSGDNVYNTTGASQNRTGSAKKGKTIIFDVSIQNDGSSADRFKVKATGTAASGYTVKYLKGAADITAAVVAGTYRTPSLAPGATLSITVRVTVKSTAAAGSNVTRLVTISSLADSSVKDAVKLVGKRA